MDECVGEYRNESGEGKGDGECECGDRARGLLGFTPAPPILQCKEV